MALPSTEATSTPSSRPSSTPTVTPAFTSTPTASPTPLGSSAVPRLAWVNHAGLDLVIEVFELEETAKLIASLPLTNREDRYQFLRFSPDGKKLAYNDVTDEGHILFIYDFETGNSHAVLTIPANVYLENLIWSPSSAYISYAYYFYGDSTQHWIYSFETGRSIYISRGGGEYWFPDEDIFVYQNAGGSWLHFDAAAGTEKPAPKIDMARLRRNIQSHDPLVAGSSCYRCYIPGIDSFELILRAREVDEVYYHLFAAGTREEIAFVARFMPPTGTPARISFNDIVPLSRGDYILYLRTWSGECPDCTSSVYTVWDLEGKLPIEVAGSSTTKSLANVVPVMLSEDENYFIGFRREDVGYADGSFSAVIVDIKTGQIIRAYRYPAVQPPAPAGLMSILAVLWSQRSQDRYPTSIDVYWGPAK